MNLSQCHEIKPSITLRSRPRHAMKALGIDVITLSAASLISIREAYRRPAVEAIRAGFRVHALVGFR